MSASVSYKVGAVTVVDGTAMADITATVTTVCQGRSCGCARTRLHTESFLVAFTATTANTIEVTGSDVDVSYADYNCCTPSTIVLDTTAVVTIS